MFKRFNELQPGEFAQRAGEVKQPRQHDPIRWKYDHWITKQGKVTQSHIEGRDVGRAYNDLGDEQLIHHGKKEEGTAQHPGADRQAGFESGMVTALDVGAPVSV